MKVTKKILNLFFVLLFTALIISCGQNEKSSPKKDDMSNMPNMDMSDKSIKHDSMPSMDMGDKNMNPDTTKHSASNISLNDVVKPTNKYVLSSLPLTTILKQTNKVDLEFYGIVSYNEKASEVISSLVSGRIDKLFVKYRFETISKGEKLMDIYSPELVTAQQDLLFLLSNDAQNTSLIESAKQKLLLLGMNEAQLNEVVRKKSVKNTITIYSNYSGHIHETGNSSSMNNTVSAMNEPSQTTQPLSLKEGMYIEKGQSLFMIYNPDDVWVLANIFPEQQPYIHKGDVIQINSGIDSAETFMGKIDFIEPEYREGSKTSNVRIYFNNSTLKLPIGSRVKVVDKNVNISGSWLPSSSILSLGKDKVVFVKSGDGFIAKKIDVKFSADDKSQINNDFSIKDSVAINAHYLIDSESFIKVK